MAELNELRAQRAILEANIAQELPRAIAEKSLITLDREPGVFAGAGSKVQDLNEQMRQLDVAIAEAEATRDAREFVAAHDEFVRLSREDDRQLQLIAKAQTELAEAQSAGREAVDWLQRYDRPGGFAHMGLTGWDHRGHEITAGGKPFGPPAELQSQIARLKAAEENLRSLRERRTNEITTPRSNLAERYPVLHAIPNVAEAARA